MRRVVDVGTHRLGLLQGSWRDAHEPTSRPQRELVSADLARAVLAPTSSSSSRTATGRPLPLSARLSMVRSGTVSALRTGGSWKLGRSGHPGSVCVTPRALCVGVFIVAGSAFAKYTEHWPLARHKWTTGSPQRRWPPSRRPPPPVWSSYPG